jgi:hypothetical protein
VIASLSAQRRLALFFGIAVPVLELGRVLLWGRFWPAPLQWPIALDALVAGGLLLWGVARAGRDPTSGLALLGVGWGVCVGMGYRTFFEQLADPTRHAGHEVLVIAMKGLLFGVAIAGAVGAVRAPRPS